MSEDHKKTLQTQLWNIVSAITQSAPPDNHLLGFKVHHLRM